jgi:zinc/manganese transport system substrate-binding protein
MSANLSRRRLLRCLLAAIFPLCPLVSQAKLNVVASLPDFGSLAREIGGDKIDLIVLGKPNENPHLVEPRSDFVGALRSADVLIESGAELERGWLPPLLQKAHNPKLDIGKPGRAEAARGIRLLEMTNDVAAGAGDAHPRGNPHCTVDPLIAKDIAQRIAKSFAAVDAPSAAFYEANYRRFETIINTKLQYWRGALQELQNEHVAAYHDDWPYFARRFGLKIDTFVEPRPGTAPSASQISDVIQKMKRDHVKSIIVEPYQDRGIVDILARSTGAKVIELSQFPGGLPGTDSYLTLMNQLVKRVAEGVK